MVLILQVLLLILLSTLLVAIIVLFLNLRKVQELSADKAMGALAEIEAQSDRLQSKLETIQKEVSALQQATQTELALMEATQRELTAAVESRCGDIVRDNAENRMELQHDLSELLPKIDKSVERWTWERFKRTDKLIERWTWERYRRMRKEHEELHNHIDLSYRDIMVVLEKQLEFIGKHDLVLKTEHPLAIDSLDYQYPRGTVNDNTRYPRFIKKCEMIFGKDKGLSFLDLGCSGGGMVLDAIIRGHFGIGLEGCDFSLIQQRAEWRLLRDNLFTCDITKPFMLSHADSGEMMRFNVITAWEVLEHIQEDDLPNLFANIQAHLSNNGYFVGSIACWDDIDPERGVNWHVTVHPPEWWQAKFGEWGFEEQFGLFDLEDMARGWINHNVGYAVAGMVSKPSYFVVLKKRGADERKKDREERK